MKNFQFNTNLGSKLTLVAGTAKLYGLQEGQPVLLSSQTVDSNIFTIVLDNDHFAYFYVVLHLEAYASAHRHIVMDDRNVLFLSIFRHEDDIVSIGERETIANIFCFCQFATLDEQSMLNIAASDRDMGVMCGMRDNLISADGIISSVIRCSPNGMETNSYAMFNFLATLLSYCLLDETTYANFIALSSGASISRSTLAAFLNMALDPWNQVQAIYELICDKPQTYTPSLPGMYTAEQKQNWSPVPDQWTLTIKVSHSGAQDFLIAGPGYIAFDENDRAWLTNNVTQGSPVSSAFCVILEPNGAPAPFSPIFGGGLLGSGFGVAANSTGSKIVVGNYGWGPKQFNPQYGSLSVIASDGSVLSPSNGYIDELSRVQGLIYDAEGNLWITSWGTQKPMAPTNGTIYDFPDQDSQIVVYLNFDGTRPPHQHEVLTYGFDYKSPYHCTFDVVPDGKGNVFVSNSGGKNDDGHVTPSSVYKLRINKDDPDAPYIECLASYSSQDSDKAFRQVSLNSQGEVFVCQVLSGTRALGETFFGAVLKFDSDLASPPVQITNNLGSPWGITFDSADTMYIANFFALHESEPAAGELDVRGDFGVTVIRNGDESTAKLMTLPTGGEPVMLANGYPLYGKDEAGNDNPYCYKPISRITGTGIDRVGNLWSLNNWKPSAYVDFTTNPGGDGVVIFIGVARPNPQY